MIHIVQDIKMLHKAGHEALKIARQLQVAAWFYRHLSPDRAYTFQEQAIYLIVIAANCEVIVNKEFEIALAGPRRQAFIRAVFEELGI